MKFCKYSPWVSGSRPSRPIHSTTYLRFSYFINNMRERSGWRELDHSVWKFLQMMKIQNLYHSENQQDSTLYQTKIVSQRNILWASWQLFYLGDLKFAWCIESLHIVREPDLCILQCCQSSRFISRSLDFLPRQIKSQNFRKISQVAWNSQIFWKLIWRFYSRGYNSCSKQINLLDHVWKIVRIQMKAQRVI